MKKITYKIRTPKPNWALSAMACFPYNKDYFFDDDREDHVLNVIEAYLHGLTYRRWSAIVDLHSTHSIKRDGNTITVSPPSGIPFLTIKVTNVNDDDKVK